MGLCGMGGIGTTTISIVIFKDHGVGKYVMLSLAKEFVGDTENCP